MRTPDQFMEYFRRNYPGPTVISMPDWHAPKIYRAALNASAYAELLEACEAQQKAIDMLFAMLIERDSNFMPSQSAAWYALIGGNAAIAKAKGETK